MTRKMVRFGSKGDEPQEKAQRRERVQLMTSACRPSSTLVLVCKDGELGVSEDTLRMASPGVLKDFIEVLKDKTAACPASSNCQEDSVNDAQKQQDTLPRLEVKEDTVEEWVVVMTLLYPGRFYTLDMAAAALRVLHKYDMASTLAELRAWLLMALPGQLNLDADSPAYLLKWLQIAENQQLDDVMSVCMDEAARLRYQLRDAYKGSGQVSEDLKQLSSTLIIDLMRTIEDRHEDRRSYKRRRQGSPPRFCDCSPGYCQCSPDYYSDHY